MRKCTYCDFTSFSGYDQTCQAAYVAALCAEISAVATAAAKEQAGGSLPLQTLFIGGGTPTVLQTGLLVRLIRHIRQVFPLAADYEWTLEANPGTVNAQQLQQLHQAGINRLSFGLQAIQPHLLQLLGRIHTFADLQSSVAAARSAGFTNINVDLLVGLPQQTMADIAQTVQAVLRLQLPHVSYYSLILEEGTPLAADCAAQRCVLPSDDLEREQYHLVRRLFAEHGLIPYEISNSARPGSACRHNRVYWEARPYYGFGVAAHRYVGCLRSCNTDDVDTYLNAWLEKTWPETGWRAVHRVAKMTETLDRQEAMREMLMLGLRLTEGVRAEAFHDRFHCSLFDVFATELAELERKALVLTDRQGVRLSERGLDLANQVFMAFVR